MPAKPFNRELKRGTLDMILLKLISLRQMYGYELVAALNQHGGELFQIKEGTLYPVLYRLEDGGFIEPRWETLERGVPRKYYRLTESGRKEMEKERDQWLSVHKVLTKLWEPLAAYE